MKKIVFIFILLSVNISFAQNRYEPYDTDYRQENTSEYDDLINQQDQQNQQVPVTPQDSYQQQSSQDQRYQQYQQTTQPQQTEPSVSQSDFMKYQQQTESLATDITRLKEAVQLLKTAQSNEISQLKDDITTNDKARKQQISQLKDDIQLLTKRIGEFLKTTDKSAIEPKTIIQPNSTRNEADNESKHTPGWQKYIPQVGNQLDLSLLILNLILTGMGILIAVLIIFNILSFFKFRKINRYIRKARSDAHIIQTLQKKAFDDKNKSRPDDIPIKPDKDLSLAQRRKLDEFVLKVTLNEMLGNELTAEDYIAVAKNYYFKEMISDALEFVDKGLKKNPKLAKAWVFKGFLYWHGKMYDEAIRTYDKALKLNPKDPEAWCNKGNSLSDLKKYKEALSAFDRAIKINPQFGEAWYNKGNVFFEMQKYGEAVEAWDRAIKINPFSEDAWYNKSCAYAVLNDRINTLECLREAVRINPDNAKSALEDPDFKWLREDDEFCKIVKI